MSAGVRSAADLKAHVKTRVLVAAAVVMVLTGRPGIAHAQRHRATADFARYDEYLREVLPDADAFRFVDTGTPHYRGHRTDANGNETLVGFGFFNVDFAAEGPRLQR